MIRPTTIDDFATLVEIARGTSVFKPLELLALGEVLRDYEREEKHQGHVAVTYELEGNPIGFAYFAPTPMTDGTWHLYWIFVDVVTQAKGIGGKLLHHAEQHIAELGGRILIVETSSLPTYQLTRRFYVKHHYEQVALIPDFYADCDDMTVFRKRLGAKS